MAELCRLRCPGQAAWRKPAEQRRVLEPTFSRIQQSDLRQGDPVLERLELEAFLILAEELHFGRTAERLHVTTGRISQTIKKLERHIGAPLFERTNRSVRLTSLGHRLHEDLRPGYEQIQTGLARAIDSVCHTRSALRIGFVGAAAGQVAHQARDLFQQREPDCPVQVREVQIIDAVARLRAGDPDILLLSLPISGPDLVIGPVLMRLGGPFAR
jgi:DNA-binding transcriptional LysR family regulator